MSMGTATPAPYPFTPRAEEISMFTPTANAAHSPAVTGVRDAVGNRVTLDLDGGVSAIRVALRLRPASPAAAMASAALQASVGPASRLALAGALLSSEGYSSGNPNLEWQAVTVGSSILPGTRPISCVLQGWGRDRLPLMSVERGLQGARERVTSFLFFVVTCMAREGAIG